MARDRRASRKAIQVEEVGRYLAEMQHGTRCFKKQQSESAMKVLSSQTQSYGHFNVKVNSAKPIGNEVCSMQYIT